MHKLFDDAIHKRLPDDLVSYIRYLLVENGGDETFLEDAVNALADFQRSDIGHDLERATAVYTEVPFAISEGDKVIRGVIDLVYELDGDWCVVDYKTDAVATDEEVTALVAQVLNQIETYAHYWEAFTHARVVSKCLWLTELRKTVVVGS